MKEGDYYWLTIKGEIKKVKVVQRLQIPIFTSLFVVEDENGVKYGCRQSDLYGSEEEAEKGLRNNKEAQNEMDCSN